MSTTPAPGTDPVTSLGPWVDHRTEVDRRGRSVTTLVNRRDHCATRLIGGEEEPGLLDSLHEAGFLRDRPAALDNGVPRRRQAVLALRRMDLRWTGVGRCVRALHGRGLRHACHPAALVLQVLLALAGCVALVHLLGSDRTFDWQVAPRHLALLLAVDLVAIAVHELGHALVVVHHGRDLDAVGVTLHLGMPACYVDATEALLLTRRQRLVQAAAGPWAEWQLTSAVAIGALAIDASAGAAVVLHRFVLLNALNIVSNLLPFVGLDGYHLLSDATRQPDLSTDARAAVVRSARAARAGRLPVGGDRLLTAYGLAEVAVSSFLIALAGVVWVATFGPAIAWTLTSGPLGVVVLATTCAVVIAVHAEPLWARARRVARRVAFRMERRWRVEAIERLRQHPSLAGLDELALGILAGRLVRLSATAVTPPDALVTRLDDRRGSLVVLDRAAA